ncbi:MAG: glycerol acyltransferase [Planctomycetota bacterium]|nr:MAG: glycerol acyltransferase [Planctomycetota bacterium]
MKFRKELELEKKLDLLAPPDPKYVDTLAEECIAPLYDHYFRCQIIGEENIPLRKGMEKPPRIFIANHSGMAFPWDAMMLGYGLARKILEPRENRKLSEMPRSLSAPALSHMPQMAPFFLPGWWKKGGCVDATFENFDTLLSRGFDVIIYPEGIAGIGKGFGKKYRLQRFSSSVVKMSIKHSAPIVPICVVNGEFINPFAYNNEEINRWVQKIGIPYLPLGPLTLFLLFPFMFYSGMPAKLYFIICKEVYPSEWAGNRSYEEIQEPEFHHYALLLRRQVQKQLLQGVKKYGRTKPYQGGEFLSHLLWKAKGHRLKLFPFMWPDLFLTHWHRFHGGKTDIFHRFMRALPYWIPLFGWLYLFYENWPRLAQKAKTLGFALQKKRPPSPEIKKILEEQIK